MDLPAAQAVTMATTSNDSEPCLKKKIGEVPEPDASVSPSVLATVPVASSNASVKMETENVQSSQECVDNDNQTKTCSVKLIDISRSSPSSDSKTIGDAVKRESQPASDEQPNAKKARIPSNPSESSRVLLKPKDFIDLKRRTVSSSNNHESSSNSPSRVKPPEDTTTKEASKTESAFDNVEEELGRLFGSSSPGSNTSSKKDTKVTISPVRPNTSFPTSSSSSSSSSAKEPVVPTSSATATAGSNPTSSGGSVTITKLSTGSTLNVESKDLKTVLSANSSSASTSNTSGSCSQVEQAQLKLKSNIDIVSLSATGSNKLPPISPPEGGSSIKCNKCNEEYSTKEARRLHTCNSILDQHYLSVENPAERQPTKTPSGSSSPNSPQSGIDASLPSSATTTVAGTATATSLSSPSSFDSASSRSNSPMTEQLQTSKKPSAKLIKEKSDKLIIEGRPKLSVTKVPRPEVGGAAAAAKPFVPKFKLSGGGEAPTTVSSSQCSLKANSDNSGNYSGKLKIKLQPEKQPSSLETSSRPNNHSEQSGPEGGLAFSFAGKPTYSPSRSEPSNGAVPTKGKLFIIALVSIF